MSHNHACMIVTQLGIGVYHVSGHVSGHVCAMIRHANGSGLGTGVVNGLGKWRDTWLGRKAQESGVAERGRRFYIYSRKNA